MVLESIFDLLVGRIFADFVVENVRREALFYLRENCIALRLGFGV